MLRGRPDLRSEDAEYTGHGKSVDWWAFGVLVFVMLTQEVCSSAMLYDFFFFFAYSTRRLRLMTASICKAPFFSENRNELWNQILNEEPDWPFYTTLSPVAMSLLKEV